MSRKLKKGLASRGGLRERWQAFINPASSLSDPPGQHPAVESEEEVVSHDVLNEARQSKRHSVSNTSLSFLSCPKVTRRTRTYTSREERRRAVANLVSAAINSTGGTGHRELSLAVVDEPPPGNRYAHAMFKNLMQNVKEGPAELLTYLTQDVLIEPNAEVQEKRGRYKTFREFASEQRSECFHAIGNELGLLPEEFLALQGRLRSSISNPFVTANDYSLEEIPIFDFAVAVFEGKDDTFIVYHRLRLSVEVDLSPAIEAGEIDEAVRERDIYLVAVWERRPFPLRVDFLAQVEGEMKRLKANHTDKGEEHEGKVPSAVHN